MSDREDNVGDTSNLVPETKMDADTVSEVVKRAPLRPNQARPRNQVGTKIPPKRSAPVQPLRRIAEERNEPVDEVKGATIIRDRVQKKVAGKPAGDAWGEDKGPRTAQTAVLLVDYPGQPNRRGATTAMIEVEDGKKIYVTKCPKCGEEITAPIGHYFHRDCETAFSFTLMREFTPDPPGFVAKKAPAVKVFGPRSVAPKPIEPKKKVVTEPVTGTIPGLKI